MYNLTRDERDFVEKVAGFSKYTPDVVKDVYISMSIAALTEISSSNRAVIPFLGTMEVCCETQNNRKMPKIKHTVSVATSKHLQESMKQLFNGSETDAEKYLANLVAEGVQLKIKDA